MAVYWSDGPGSETPPGHWNLIAQWLSRRHRQTLDQDAKMFFALNGGLLDASIAAWECKYVFDYARPISLIRHFKAGRTVTAWRGPYLGVGPIQGETWRPYIPTPNFPEYTSGHSTFSAAAAAVLKDFRGADALERQRQGGQGHLVRRAGHRHPGRRARHRPDPDLGAVRGRGQ